MLHCVVLLLSACDASQRCEPAVLAPLPRTPSYAFVASDYASSAIGLLDSDGTLITDAWLDSGTAQPGIVAALSGDVSLPATPFATCTMTVLDRFGTDVVSLLDTCGDMPVRAQIDVGEAFSANPHDVLSVGGRLWVTRYGVNLAVPSSDPAHGDDIAVLDGERVVTRIDLSSGASGEAFARPDRMVRLAHPSGAVRVVVGLARLSPDFMVAGPGALAVIDPETLAVRIEALDGFSQCGELDRAGDAVVVTCVGAPFASEAERRGGAGILSFRLTESGALEPVEVWRAAEHPDQPVPSGPTVAISASRWITVAWADTVFGDGVASASDRVLWVDAAQGVETLFESPPFTIGDGVYDEAHDLLLLPDAALGGIRRLRADGTEREPVLTASCRGLPPREVRRVAFP